MSETATRSLIEPPGLNASTFATIGVATPGHRRDSRTSGVAPIVSRIDSRIAGVGGGSVRVLIRPIVAACGGDPDRPKEISRSRYRPCEDAARSATLPCVPNDRPTPPLDDVDRAILEALSDDARLPNNRLAERVGVAPSTCLQRVRALRRSGVLRGFHADI